MKPKVRILMTRLNFVVGLTLLVNVCFTDTKPLYKIFSEKKNKLSNYSQIVMILSFEKYMLIA